jgi:hypothetical protein
MIIEVVKKKPGFSSYPCVMTPEGISYPLVNIHIAIENGRRNT